jgi:hypothetical protein
LREEAVVGAQTSRLFYLYVAAELRMNREIHTASSSALRKEVIQPQVPLRLPCYDFTPVADPTVAGRFLAVS